jgi:5-methylcytosine-specific restriction enzyme A
LPTIKLHNKRPRIVTVNKQLYQYIYQDSRWRKLRKAKLSNNPVCEICELSCKVTPTAEIHHLKPFEIGNDKFEIEKLAYDYDNLISVCVTCHKYLHMLISNTKYRKAISNRHILPVEPKILQHDCNKNV